MTGNASDTVDPDDEVEPAFFTVERGAFLILGLGPSEFCEVGNWLLRDGSPGGNPALLALVPEVRAGVLAGRVEGPES